MNKEEFIQKGQILLSKEDVAVPPNGLQGDGDIRESRMIGSKNDGLVWFCIPVIQDFHPVFDLGLWQQHQQRIAQLTQTADGDGREQLAVEGDFVIGG